MNAFSVRPADPLRWLWHAVRVPILALLTLLEPVVTFVCGGLALLGLLTTFFFKIVGLPHFPFWHMIALSMGIFCVRVAYEIVLRVLSG